MIRPYIVHFKCDWWRCLCMAYWPTKEWKNEFGSTYIWLGRNSTVLRFLISQNVSVCVILKYIHMYRYRWFVEYALLEFLSFCCRNGQFWNGRQLLCRQPLCRSLCQRIPCGKPLFDWLEKFLKPLSLLMRFYAGWCYVLEYRVLGSCLSR